MPNGTHTTSPLTRLLTASCEGRLCSRISTPMETVTMAVPQMAGGDLGSLENFDEAYNAAHWDDMADYSSDCDENDLSSPIQPVPGRGREYDPQTYVLPNRGAGKTYDDLPPSPELYHGDSRDGSPRFSTPPRRPRALVYTPPEGDYEANRALQALKICPGRGLEMMFEAAMRGRANVVRALIAAGVKAHPGPDCDEDEDEYFVPIHTAAYKGQLECVKVLVREGGVDPDDVSVGHTVLMRAVMSGNPNLVRWLLETRRVNPIRRLKMEEDDYSLGALEIAALEGKVACAEVLVAFLRKTDISVRSCMTNVLMECAGMSGSEPFLERALSWAGLPDLATLSGTKPPLLNSAERAKIEAAMIGASRTGKGGLARSALGFTHLKHAKISWSPVLLSALRDGLVTAAGKNDLESFINFFDLSLSKEMDRHVFNKTLANALYEAADRGARDMVVVLVEKYGVNVNDGSHNPHELTPLIAASGRGHLEVVQYLVDEAGADIRIGAGRENDSPLWFAVKGFHQDVALFLLRHGGPVNEIFPPWRPNFSRPDRIYLRIIRFLGNGNGVKIFLDRGEATKFDLDADRGCVDIEGLTSADEEWWDRIETVNSIRAKRRNRRANIHVLGARRRPPPVNS